MPEDGREAPVLMRRQRRRRPFAHVNRRRTRPTRHARGKSRATLRLYTSGLASAARSRRSICSSTSSQSSGDPPGPRPDDPRSSEILSPSVRQDKVSEDQPSSMVQ